MEVDPYVYPGTDTLKNRMGIRDAEHLSAVEADVTEIALYDVIRKGVPGNYDLAHLQAFHRAIFGKVYPWAGEIRTVDIGKPVKFAHAPFITSHLNEQFAKLAREQHLQGLSRDQFVDRLSHYLGEVNAAHPFREGNGRTQRAFFGQLASSAGWRIAWERMDPGRNVEVSIASHNGDDSPQRAMLAELVEQAP